MGWEQTKIAGSGALRGIIEVDTHPNAFFPYNHSHPSYTPSLPQVERALEMLTLGAYYKYSSTAFVTFNR